MNDRRFVILDPCLDSAGSHPLAFAAELLAAAAAAGFACRLVTNHRFAPRDCPPAWDVAPAFTNTAYSKYNAFGGLDRLDTCGRPPLLPRSPWALMHAGRRREQRIAAFAREVAPTLSALRSGDVVLLATASELEAAGLARAIAAVAPPRGIDWHVLFHFPIFVGFGPDFPRQERQLGPVAELLRQAHATAAPHELRWHATTAEIAAQYARLGAGPVNALPYPIRPVPPRAPRSAAAGPLRIACLGDARPEKGSQHLAAAVARVFADESLAGAVAFAIQTNLGFRTDSRAPEHRAVRESLTRLAILARDCRGIELLGGPLDPAAYAREVVAADAMLLPYDQARYRVRCSGVILEALAAGTVPIVTGGGWMARQLAEPQQRHVAAVVARCAAHDAARLTPTELNARRPLVVPLAPPASARGRAATLMVDVTWRSAAAWLDEPPVRLEVRQGEERVATIVAATAERSASALLPIEASDVPLHLACAPACVAPRVEVEAIHVRWLVADRHQPLSAVGIVIESHADIPAAMREFIRHRDHYRETAARHATIAANAASATALLRALIG
jgi:hypothetical protein